MADADADADGPQPLRVRAEQVEDIGFPVNGEPGCVLCERGLHVDVRFWHESLIGGKPYRVQCRLVDYRDQLEVFYERPRPSPANHMNMAPPGMHSDGPGAGEGPDVGPGPGGDQP